MNSVVTKSLVDIETSLGTIRLELDPSETPNTVANFLDYVKKGHYDGTVFHRVINNFMIQGGGFEPGMKQKPTKDPISHEGTRSQKNVKYSVAMARTSVPHSATSQFFINLVDNSFLDFTVATAQGYGYCVFGKVVAGEDVIEKIRAVKTGRKGFHDDVPLEDVVILKAALVEATPATASEA